MGCRSVGPWESIQDDQSVLTVLTLTAMILVAGLYRDVCGRPVSGSVGINTGLPECTNCTYTDSHDTCC